MGNSTTADNHRSLNDNANTVANFRIASPTISAFSVSPATRAQGQPFTINYTVAASGGLNRVVLRRTSGNGSASDPGWQDISTNPASGINPVSGSFSNTPPGAGTYWYGMSVYDNQGNSTNERQAGKGPVQVTVTATCSYSLSPAGLSAGAAAAVGNINVTTTSGCAWTAMSNTAWITVTPGASGSGNGSVGYYVAVNPGASSRTGTLTIAGKTFTVIQNGAGTLPAAPTIGIATPGNGSISVAFTPGSLAACLASR